MTSAHFKWPVSIPETLYNPWITLFYRFFFKVKYWKLIIWSLLVLTLLIHSISEFGQCYLINIFLIHHLIPTLILSLWLFFVIFIFLLQWSVVSIVLQNPVFPMYTQFCNYHNGFILYLHLNDVEFTLWIRT